MVNGPLVMAVVNGGERWLKGGSRVAGSRVAPGWLQAGSRLFQCFMVDSAGLWWNYLDTFRGGDASVICWDVRSLEIPMIYDTDV